MLELMFYLIGKIFAKFTGQLRFRNVPIGSKVQLTYGRKQTHRIESKSLIKYDKLAECKHIKLKKKQLEILYTTKSLTRAGLAQSV
jgi:hypothetical protein